MFIVEAKTFDCVVHPAPFLFAMMNYAIRSLAYFRYYFVFLGKYLGMLLRRIDCTIFAF